MAKSSHSVDVNTVALRRCLSRVLAATERERFETACELLSIPEVEATIRHLMRNVSTAAGRELQFSVLCALSETSRGWRGRLGTELATQFLLTARDNRASAAWMAADLLGEHRPVRIAEQALRLVVEEGEGAEGRDLALSALAGLYERLRMAGQRRVLALLGRTATNDRSAGVRRYAGRLVEEIAGPRTHGDNHATVSKARTTRSTRPSRARTAGNARRTAGSGRVQRPGRRLSR